MNYVTPTNYLELVQGYMGMLKEAAAGFTAQVQGLGLRVGVRFRV